MERVTVSKLQAVEIAKGISEASDEKLAFLLQVQEIVKSTTAEFAGSGEEEEEEEEELFPPSHSGTDLLVVMIVTKTEDVALNLAAGELRNFVQETDETQLSLLEANRLAHLDAIQAHDAHFIANMPPDDWDATGDEVEDPINDFLGLNELSAHNEVDHEFDSVLSQFGDTSSVLSKRLRAGVGEKLHEMPRRVMDRQQEKGKKRVVQEDDLASLLSSLSRSAETFKDGVEDGQTDSDDDVRTCQICFEAPSSFVSVEGCGHAFCERCVTRHAETKILDGAPHIPCPHVGCQKTISYTQLSFLLPSKTLEILSRSQIEAAIPASERVYCPFSDCSALLFKPSLLQAPSSSSAPPICVECEACHRALCSQCIVAWHADMTCAEHKATTKNRLLLGDEKLLQLASKRKWQRCEKCGLVVELRQGCYHIHCRCGNSFCYVCGLPWIESKKPCICPMFGEDKL